MDHPGLVKKKLKYVPNTFFPYKCNLMTFYPILQGPHFRNVSMPNLVKPTTLDIKFGTYQGRPQRSSFLNSPNDHQRKNSSVDFDYPDLSFEEKKERLKDVLFGDKNISRENVDTPIKGKYNLVPLRKINLLHIFEFLDILNEVLQYIILESKY